MQKIISFIFHPLLMLSYALIMLYSANKNALGADADIKLISIFFTSFLMPAIAVLMMRFLGLLKSFESVDRYDQIAPMLISGVFYLWIFRNLYSNPQLDELVLVIILGACITLFLTFFLNLFSRVYMHAAGIGFILISTLLIHYKYAGSKLPLLNMGENVILVDTVSFFIVAIIAATLILSSRFKKRPELAKEDLGACFMGLSGPLIAYFYY
jgi:hypothetical protein